MCKKTTNTFFLLWLALSCSFLPCSAQSEPAETSSAKTTAVYRITESELNRLETNLAILAEDNRKRQTLLNGQERQLETALKEIERYKTLNEETQTLLRKANQSLNEYEKEAQHKQAVKKRQRDTWMAVAVLAAGYALAK